MTMPQKSEPSMRPRSDKIGPGELESPRERHRKLRDSLAGANKFFETADNDWVRLAAVGAGLSYAIVFLYSELDTGEKDLIRLLCLFTLRSPTCCKGGRRRCSILRAPAVAVRRAARGRWSRRNWRGH